MSLQESSHYEGSVVLAGAGVCMAYSFALATSHPTGGLSKSAIFATCFGGDSVPLSSAQCLP
jgi:hypothetical protein